ncbi:TolC family protein [Salisaeta longa]|uniref:TolC family protein n=1 Tax=Salisaeta longa TaxID=503170 RepID=UPI0003B3B036|nr:TolC family protein [Salisaeta longa]
MIQSFWQRKLLMGILVSALGLLAASGNYDVSAHPRSVSDTLFFKEATALLLKNNPQLRAARARTQALSMGAQAQSLFPNPTLGLSEEYTPYTNADGADNEWFLQLSQPLRYPGEQRARRQAAEAASRAAKAALQETRTALYNSLRRRYLNVVVASARLRILKRYTEAVRRAARAATARYEEGDLSAIRYSRLMSARATYESDLAAAQRKRQAAQMQLTYMLMGQQTQGLDGPSQIGAYVIPDSLSFRAITVNAPAAVAAATSRRPLLKAQQARVEYARQTLRATRYQQYPGLGLSAGPKRLATPGGSSLGFTAGITMTLPLWNGGRTAVEAQRGRRNQAQAQLDAFQRSVAGSVHDALRRLKSAQTLLQTSDLQVTTSLQDALFVYEQGEITLFELLDTIASARRTELLQVRLRAEYFRALYDLETAIGVGPHDAPIVVEGALSPLRSARLP